MGDSQIPMFPKCCQIHANVLNSSGREDVCSCCFISNIYISFFHSSDNSRNFTSVSRPLPASGPPCGNRNQRLHFATDHSAREIVFPDSISHLQVPHAFLRLHLGVPDIPLKRWPSQVAVCKEAGSNKNINTPLEQEHTCVLTLVKQMRSETSDSVHTLRAANAQRTVVTLCKPHHCCYTVWTDALQMQFSIKYSISRISTSNIFHSDQ